MPLLQQMKENAADDKEEAQTASDGLKKASPTKWAENILAGIEAESSARRARTAAAVRTAFAPGASCTASAKPGWPFSRMDSA